MLCFFCRSEVPRTSSDVSAVLCGGCVQRITGAPAEAVTAKKKVLVDGKVVKRKRGRPRKNPVKAKKASVGRGRGWHLKKLFQYENQYYSFGKPISEKEASQMMASA